jgi:hypothetical protein
MPPPRRAKIEINEEPKARPINGFTRSDIFIALVSEVLRHQRNPATEMRPRPTTSRPVMAPPLKAMSSAGPMPRRAASAVRTFARTDTFMPM